MYFYRNKNIEVDYYIEMLFKKIGDTIATFDCLITLSGPPLTQIAVSPHISRRTFACVVRVQIVARSSILTPVVCARVHLVVTCRPCERGWARARVAVDPVCAYAAVLTREGCAFVCV